MEDIKRKALLKILQNNQIMSYPYQTNLSPSDELGFNIWQQENKVPYDSSSKSDYDMKGFYKALKYTPEEAKSDINPIDNQLHFTDRFKTPYHESFSRESKYATDNDPYWDQDRLKDKKGNTIFISLPYGQ